MYRVEHDVSDIKQEMAIMKKDITAMKQDITFIKERLTEKIDRSEFIALEKRVSSIELKMQK